VTATYSGDAGFDPSSGTTDVTVDLASSAVDLVSSTNPSVASQPVTFTATVTTVAPGVGVPTGTVSFHDGATLLGTGTVDGSGVATFTAAGFSVGTHAITATYDGDSTHAPAASAAVSQSVAADTTSLTLRPITRGGSGAPTTLVADVVAVAPATAVPTGTVSFFVGGSLLGTADVVDGVATLSVDGLGDGVLVVSASYAPASSTFAASTAAPVDVAAAPAADQPDPSVPPTTGSSDPTTGELPVTGSAPGASVAVATLLILLGLGAVGVSRRRSSTR
jgi:hypothetical protein